MILFWVAELLENLRQFVCIRSSNAVKCTVLRLIHLKNLFWHIFRHEGEGHMNWRTRSTKYYPTCPLVPTSGMTYRTVMMTGRDENTRCRVGTECTNRSVAERRDLFTLQHDRAEHRYCGPSPVDPGRAYLLSVGQAHMTFEWAEHCRKRLECQ